MTPQDREKRGRPGYRSTSRGTTRRWVGGGHVWAKPGRYEIYINWGRAQGLVMDRERRDGLLGKAPIYPRICQVRASGCPPGGESHVVNATSTRMGPSHGEINPRQSSSSSNNNNQAGDTDPQPASQPGHDRPDLTDRRMQRPGYTAHTTLGQGQEGGDGAKKRGCARSKQV